MTELSAAFHLPLLRERASPWRAELLTLASGWRLVVLCTVLSVFIAAMVLRSLPPEHTASMVVGPIARTGASAMGARTPIASRSDMPASVLEFGNGEETLSDFARFVELICSPVVAAQLMNDPSVLAHLFSERWDSATGRWHTPGGLSGWLRALILGLAGQEDWSEPDPDILSRYLRRTVIVQSLGTNPMRRISFRDSDRAFAVNLLHRLTAAADAHLRAEAARRANAEIAFIRASLATAQSADSRKALVELLSDQERVAMIIGVDLPFAADPIEPPTASKQPDWPNPLIILPLAATVGGGLGLFLVFSRRAWQEPVRRVLRRRNAEVTVE